jgi:hypothetical protein
MRAGMPSWQIFRCIASLRTIWRKPYPIKVGVPKRGEVSQRNNLKLAFAVGAAGNQLVSLGRPLPTRGRPCLCSHSQAPRLALASSMTNSGMAPGVGATEA